VRKPRRDEMWDRSPGGVIVPRRVTLPTRRHIGWLGTAKDCCGEVIPPSCNCYSITISGLSNGTCTKCSALNKAWLVQLTDTNTWSCTLSSICGLCGDESLILTYDPDTNTWEASCVGVVWSAEGSECGTLTLAYVSSTGYCNGDASSVSIAPYTGANPCSCSCAVTCYACESKVAGFLEVTIDGLVDDGCSGCNEANGTYLLEWNACGTNICNCPTGSFVDSSNGGRWTVTSAVDFCNNWPVCGFNDLRVTFNVVWTGTVWYAILQLASATQTGGCSSCTSGTVVWKQLMSGTSAHRDCTDIDVSFTPADACTAASSCDISGATATVVAA